MRVLVLLSVCMVAASVSAQPNCEIYKQDKQTACYEGCNLAVEAANEQGTSASQEQFDKAIALCPALDYAYMEKSVPYLKRGDFITWKSLIDKAVELNPLGHLGYRGWCRFQFLRDYKGAIADFETLATLNEFNIGYSQNGDYHLNIAKALCYKAIGEKKKAIDIIERHLANKDYSPLPYDYLHLGVLKLEIADTVSAITNLKKSIELNDYFAEPHYFLGMIYKGRNSKMEYREYMEKAKTYYLKGYKRFDPYTHPIDKIFLKQIEHELSNGDQ